MQGDSSEANQAKISRSTTMVELLDAIENRGEPTPEELQGILAKLKTLRFEFRTVLDKMTKSVKQNLPRKPGTGRPSDLTLSQKKEACKRVGLLMSQGVEVQDALSRVAQRFGVGRRTIQRAWQKRRELHKLPGDS